MKKLADLLSDDLLVAVHGDPGVEVGAVRFDSRQVAPGDLFVAVRGFARDGGEFVADAIRRGAVAVVSVQPPSATGAGVTWAQVSSDRRALSRIAARFHDNPSLRMDIIGVTGTKGKSTTAALAQAFLNRRGPTAVVGTVGMGYGDVWHQTPLTTPEAPQLFAFLAEAERAGCRQAVMEVSSASLTLARVDDVRFQQAVFTSFSGDHLDYHGTMEDYLEAKLTLFRGLGANGWAVINGDCEQSPRVISELSGRYLTFGFGPAHDIRPLKFRFSLAGISAQLQTPRGRLDVESPLVGRFNLMNIMAAAGAALVQGVAPEEIGAALRNFRTVRGRLEVAYSGDFLVLVDYAHTDDALRNVLETLREVGSGRLIVMFGCGGSRDRSKRPRMGRVAAELADVVVLTSDNPRQEEPEAIIDEVAAGVDPAFAGLHREVDRTRAIALALRLAAPGDIVVLAGKGHEEYQIFRDRTVPFSDFAVVRELLGKGHAGA